MGSIWGWALFGTIVLGMLALDLGIFSRKSHAPRMREALIWSGVWITIAMLFNLGIWVTLGARPAIEFLTAYLLEKSLSVDNLFVFLLIFSYFQIPMRLQHKVLFWGILGALLMRAVFIALGVTLIERFHWIIYVFGGFLILTGVRMMFAGESEIHPERNLAVRLVKRVMPVKPVFEEDHFWIRESGRVMITPLFLALVLIESTDVFFAIDSIPAVLAVTQDPFIVYTSNVFAILGLRSLYFTLAGTLDKLRYLKQGLATVLVFVGAKMAFSDLIEVPIQVSLAVIAAILAVAAGFSIWASRRECRAFARQLHFDHEEPVRSDSGGAPGGLTSVEKTNRFKDTGSR